jgi:uncharacterized phage-associated protein
LSSRVDDVAAAVMSELGGMEAMKLEKLVYYVEAWHVAMTDSPAFGEPVEAWRDGPVVDHLYQQHKRSFRVHSWPSGDPSKLSPLTRELVRTVCGVYGDLSGDDLSELTHAEEPWRAARRGYADHERSRRAISHDLMRNYYGARKLAGRYPSDLAVGGLNYAYVARADRDEVRGMVEDLKDTIRRRRESHGNDESVDVPVSRHKIDGPAFRASQTARRTRPKR